ncbi:MAG TPA: single-stranded DNA-binding protein [bacterium]|jgi:single-strand DNA-binding protein
MGVNKVILIGNLGGKPEVRYTPSGTAVANFSVATTERWGRDEQTGQTKEHTEWHRCVAWRKLAEIVGQYLDKGSKVYIEGRIRQDEYTDQQGVKRWSFKINVDNLEMLSARGVREEVPTEPKYQNFPDTSSSGNNGGGGQSPPDTDMDDEFDLEEDDEFLIE